MLFNLIDLLVTYQPKLLAGFFKTTSILKIMWLHIWIEWLLLQTAIVYVVYNISQYYNYFKQIINLLMFIIFLCVFVSILQFELFACFLFVSEFTIIIFFYCLFVHLKQNIYEVASFNNNSRGLSLTLITFIALLLSNKFLFYFFLSDDLYLTWLNTYNLFSSFALNDLSFFFYFFTKYHLTLYLMVGVILFIITLFLLYAVVVYFITNSIKKISTSPDNSKITFIKGLYEKTAVSLQKFFKN